MTAIPAHKPQGDRLRRLPTQNRTESTITAIETLITERGLKPGDPLPSENQICSDLGVSRSAVREAMSQLQALDIVQIQRGRGSFVGDMSLTPLIKILLLRSSLDPESSSTLSEVVAVRLILDRGFGPALVNKLAGTRHPELHRIVEHMAVTAAAGQSFMPDDIAFHQAIYAYGPTLLRQLGTALWEIHMTALSAHHLPIGDLTATAAAHRTMLETAEAGDLPGYLAAVDQHYQPLLTSLAEAQ